MTPFIEHNSVYLVKRLLKEHVSPYKGKIFLAIFFMTIVASCTAAIVRIVEPAIDQVFLTKDREALVVLPLVMLAIYCIKGIAEYFQSYIIKYVGQQILTDLQMRMYQHLLLADLDFIQSQSSGKLISRFTNDIVLMRGAVSNMLVGFAKHFLSVTFLIIIMFNLDIYLSFFAFVAFPLAIYPIQRVGKRMRNVVGKAQEELSNYTARLDESFQSIKIIKSFSTEKTEAKKAKEIIANILKHYKNTAKYDAFTSPIMEILSGLAIACILWYGGLRVISGESTPGTLFSFITAFVSAYRPFKSLVSLNVNLQEGLVAANRVFNILDLKSKIHDIKNAKEVKFTSPKIELSNIKLQLEQKIAIDDISFTIDNGKTYALVGKSGSGKTSIANLLVRFYDPTLGTIKIDGYSLKDLKIKSLRDQVALVTQDNILFDATIAENIAYGNKEATREEIIAAARSADADEFIINLPNGYDTNVGVGGSTLSGGQKQRIAIARAFLKNAPILVLDEATSALDPKSEQSILNALKELRKNRTTLVITHRLTTITDVDQIVVLKAGKVLEQGSYDELLKKNGEFFTLLNKELKEKKENV